MPIELQNAFKNALQSLEPIELKVLSLRYGIDPSKLETNYQDFEVTGAVFEKLIEPTLIQPTFVTHLPKELVPLAKLSPDDPTTVEVLSAALTARKLRRPTPRRTTRLSSANDSNIRAAASSKNWTRIFWSRWSTACRRPAAWAWALTVSCMMLLGQESIRDVILFPQLKPK